MSKKLVAYFSATGTTADVAKIIAEEAGADLYEIKPEVPYEKKDLNWMNPLSRSTKEMRNKDSRPAIIKGDVDLAEYDTVLIGYPVWWYIAPTVINTFLEAYDFSDKKIILFATSGSSGFGKSVEHLLGSVSKTTEITEGTVFSGKINTEEVKNWAKTL